MSVIKSKVRESLKNWTTFNAQLLGWTEAELLSMLKYERKHQQRKTFVERILKRIGRLKAIKAKEEL